MSDFGKELINTNVDNETLKQEILARITKIKSPLFNVDVNIDEILIIKIQFKDVTEIFEIFDVTPESVDVTLHKINDFVKGLSL